MLSCGKNFRFYLDHPDPKMDNNITEWALVKVAIGPKHSYISEVDGTEKQ